MKNHKVEKILLVSYYLKLVLIFLERRIGIIQVLIFKIIKGNSLKFKVSIPFIHKSQRKLLNKIKGKKLMTLPL